MKKLLINFISLICVATTIWAQEQFVISGVVSDDTGPLPGVTIYAKNRPGVGTSSDINGKFSLRVFRNDNVVFSFIGY